jgi:hypothetical protein
VVAIMQRWVATDIRARAMPTPSETHEKLALYAAWLDVRARSSRGSPEDRTRAADAAQWLKHWLQHLCSPPTATFILARAEEEVSALADGTDGPHLRPQP